jgi:hypothetical protein
MAAEISEVSMTLSTIIETARKEVDEPESLKPAYFRHHQYRVQREALKPYGWLA